MRDEDLSRFGVYIEEILDPKTRTKDIRRTVYMRDYYVVTMFELIKDPETKVMTLISSSEERYERKSV